LTCADCARTRITHTEPNITSPASGRGRGEGSTASPQSYQGEPPEPVLGHDRQVIITTIGVEGKHESTKAMISSRSLTVLLTIGHTFLTVEPSATRVRLLRHRRAMVS
jgi:hypothetical protein